MKIFFTISHAFLCFDRKNKYRDIRGNSGNKLYGYIEPYDIYLLEFPDTTDFVSVLAIYLNTVVYP